jgi:tRNA 2-thiouridine synthesizing protein B
VCGSSDAILLIEDGVFASLKGNPCDEAISAAITAGIKVFAIENDICARGLSKKIRNDIQIVDYTGFVRLSVSYNCTQSWY